MNIKIYKTDKTEGPTPDFEVRGKMVVVEVDNGVPIALVRELGPNQYAITDARDPTFEAALVHFGIPFKLHLIRESAVSDLDTSGKIIVPG